LDRQIVVFRLAVVVRFAAPAIVEGKDSPRTHAIARQHHRQLLEIGGGPRQPRQANHREGAVPARAMGADGPAQPVLHAHELTSAGRGGSLVGMIAGTLRHRCATLTWSVGPYEDWYHLSRGGRAAVGRQDIPVYDADNRAGKSVASDGPNRRGRGGLSLRARARSSSVRRATSARSHPISTRPCR